MKIIFKSVEEIRQTRTDLNQTDYANSLGLAFRTYQERIQGVRSDWKISELIAASVYNDGEVCVELNDKKYEIVIKSVE